MERISEKDIFEIEEYLNEGIVSNALALATGDPTNLAVKTLTTATISYTVRELLKSKKDVLSLDFKKPSPANLIASDTNSNNNKIKTKPLGIIICDTLNNPIFPIPYPLIDDSKFNLPFVKEQYIGIYATMPVDFLPWHYVIEMVNSKYYAFQTRPLDMRYPVDTLTASNLIKSNNLTLSETTNNFFKSPPFDLQDAIHVCIMGDTNKDVYIEKLYELIGRLVSGSILRYFKLPTKTHQRVINFNLGNKFAFNKLDLYLAR